MPQGGERAADGAPGGAELGVLEEFAAVRGGEQVRMSTAAGARELFPPAAHADSEIVGDTHHYERTHPPFDEEDVADLVLCEGARLFAAGPLTVRRRWRGIYADSPRTDFLVAAPEPGVRVVAVTSGIGMTTALGLAPAVLDGLG